MGIGRKERMNLDRGIQIPSFLKTILAFYAAKDINKSASQNNSKIEIFVC